MDSDNVHGPLPQILNSTGFFLEGLKVFFKWPLIFFHFQSTVVFQAETASLLEVQRTSKTIRLGDN